MDHVEVILERRGLHARIDRGKSAADIDDVDRDRGVDDRRAHPLERLDIGERGHRLAADVEADAEPVRDLASRLEQRRRIREIDPELGREAELGILGRHPQPHAQAQVGRNGAVVRAGCGDDLCKLLVAVEAESAYAMLAIGFADRTRGLHRVHEAQRCLWERTSHQPHFGDRGDVEVRDAAVPQNVEQVGRGIGLHRIERLARELLAEEPGCARRCMRAVENDRFVRRQGAGYSRCVMIAVQFKGPPIGLSAKTTQDEAALRFGSPHGAAGGRYRAPSPNCKRKRTHVHKSVMVGSG